VAPGLYPAAVKLRRVQPTREQIDAYRRDGFLVLDAWLDADEVARLRERFGRCFAHEWETGIAPDEVNYDPETTPPDRTRQLCNVWKADTTLGATVLAERIAAFGARLAGLPGARRHGRRHRHDLLRPRLQPLAAGRGGRHVPRSRRLARPRP
jgi:hypothetical protein